MVFLIFLILVVFSNLSYSSDFYNSVKVDGYTLSLDKDKKGFVHILSHEIDSFCKIENWVGGYGKGAGVIQVTTDGKAVLVAGTDSYLYVKDILKCNGGKVFLNKNPVPDKPPFGMVIDINFDKRIYLSVILNDASSSEYTAIVSKFNSNESIVKSKGFEGGEDSDNEDSTFYLSDIGYGGRISLNGRYVYPSDLDCSIDSFPGVWDLVTRKKVVFTKNNLSNEDVEFKCKALFNGETELEVLGGKLIQP
ncbi:hypothetical protein [Hafnia paralvei]|uniref:hypothetical protein n=1 Tax=Hafnia paralvei TaxID=546367 RepID=UPI001F30D436|nr:hypothetical protein [Hafnia paralvei]MCE9949726.1 hypothetical protein [Hafnia paralvei]